MVDPQPSASLEDLLAKWGVEVHDDIILDRLSQTYVGDPTIPMTFRYSYHRITNPISRVMTFFPMCRSLAPKPGRKKGLDVVELVKGGDSSWGETNIQSLLTEKHAGFDEKSDIKGPVCMAVAVSLKQEKQSKQPTAPNQSAEQKTPERRVLVVVGDSDFASNKWLQEGNPDFFMNSLNWLAEEENLISIRPKDQEQQSQVRRVTGKQLRFVTYTSIFAIPVLLMIAGGLVWWRRR